MGMQVKLPISLEGITFADVANGDTVICFAELVGALVAQDYYTQANGEAIFAASATGTFGAKAKKAASTKLNKCKELFDKMAGGSDKVSECQFFRESMKNSFFCRFGFLSTADSDRELTWGEFKGQLIERNVIPADC